MIDEYQDINFAQYRLIKLLVPEANSNICAIGDPNQAIYGFRGSDVKFIEQFVYDYRDAVIYRLIKSYRCSDYIIKASNEIISVNKPEKIFLESIQKGVKIKIRENSSDKSEAEFVARTIENMIGGLGFFSIDSDITGGNQNAEIKSLSDFAVLCRTKSQINVIEKAFNDHSVPFQTVGDYSLFQEMPLKLIIDILKLSINPENNFLKNKIHEVIAPYPLTISKFNNLIKGKSVKSIAGEIINIFFEGSNKKDEILLKSFIDLVDYFGDNKENFLKFASLGTEVDRYKPDIENVTIMTLHAAKGLEFKCVFIIGCEEGLLPYSLFKEHTADLSEERRLLYVGMTRAQKLLFLSYARKRFIFGREYNLGRSSFLDNIENALVEFLKDEYTRKEKQSDNQLSLF